MARGAILVVIESRSGLSDRDMNPSKELEILYRDDDLIIVNKPAGLVSETADRSEDSVLRRVEEVFQRPVVVYHRLDKDTSGCLLLGRTARHNRAIAALFSGKKIRKEYWAVVYGSWPGGVNRVETCIRPLHPGRWTNHAELGKRSLTTFRCLGRAGDRSWIQALPKTGRPHQIRLHCLQVGCPVVGDRLYGPPGPVSGRLALHARRLSFRHPGGDGMVEVEAPLPPGWEEWLEGFR